MFKVNVGTTTTTKARKKDKNKIRKNSKQINLNASETFVSPDGHAYLFQVWMLTSEVLSKVYSFGELHF